MAITDISLTEPKITELKELFETFGRLPSEDINKTFVQAAVQWVQEHLNKELADDDVSPQISLALINLSLFFYNQRDFQSKTKEAAVYNYVRGLLEFYYPQSKFISRDKDDTNSLDE